MFLFTADLLGYLLASEDLCTPMNYLNRYDKPLDLVLDSGKLTVVTSSYNRDVGILIGHGVPGE